jgi:hypothetical protein
LLNRGARLRKSGGERKTEDASEEAESLDGEGDDTEAKSLHEEQDATEVKSLHPEDQQRPLKRHRGSKPANELSPVEGTLFNAPGGSTESPHGSLPSQRDTAALYDRLIPLQQEWIERERKRSDQNKSWEKEMAWAAEFYNNNISLGLNTARVYWCRDSR